LGIASRSSAVLLAIAGSVDRREERWSDEAITDLCDRLDSACRDSCIVCDVWAKDWGSVVFNDESGRVVSLFRYEEVIGSLEDGGGRGEGASK
jgi:hypothetical protein